jgi:hypothetical protein
MAITYGADYWIRINDDNDAPGVRVYLRGGKEGVRELYLVAEGDREITPTMLRRFPLRRLLTKATARWDLRKSGAEKPAEIDLEEQAESLFPWPPIKADDPGFRVMLQPPGPDGISDEFLQQVARAYRDALRFGERPNVALAKQSGCPKRTIERYVYLARKVGHLVPTVQGSSGYMLPPRRESAR